MISESSGILNKIPWNDIRILWNFEQNPLGWYQNPLEFWTKSPGMISESSGMLNKIPWNDIRILWNFEQNLLEYFLEIWHVCITDK
jgi:hypothetical protein